MDSIFNNGKLIIEANPQYYDYAHEIRLNSSNKTFSLLNGGGQKMDEMYYGRYELTEDTITLHFENQEDVHDSSVKPMNATNVIKYKLIMEDKKHFDGYSMKVSKCTVVFDKSLFAINERKCVESGYPLTFYTNLDYVDCNTLLERFKRDREYFFSELFEDHPEIVKDDIYTTGKNKYEKQVLSVSDDILIKIMNLTDDLLNKADTPLQFITWLYSSDKEVVFYQSDVRTMFIVGQHEINTWYYGRKRKDDSGVKNYEFPRDWELIKENILSYPNSKIKPDYDALYLNLQKFREETWNLLKEEY